LRNVFAQFRVRIWPLFVEVGRHAGFRILKPELANAAAGRDAQDLLADNLLVTRLYPHPAVAEFGEGAG
jgi:hypothetical protein